MWLAAPFELLGQAQSGKSLNVLLPADEAAAPKREPVPERIPDRHVPRTPRHLLRARARVAIGLRGELGLEGI